MYQNIMLPLDGSDLAECVFPHLEAIALGCRVPSVTLIYVAEPIGIIQPRQEEWRDRQLHYITAAQNYLNEVTNRLTKLSQPIRTEVLQGRAAESIISFAVENNIDLIIMATHGRSGVSRWVWGSVADRVLRASRVPVLLVRATNVD